MEWLVVEDNDPNDPDPDWKVKQCIFLTVAGATYPEVRHF